MGAEKVTRFNLHKLCLLSELKVPKFTVLGAAPPYSGGVWRNLQPAWGHGTSWGSGGAWHDL